MSGRARVDSGGQKLGLEHLTASLSCHNIKLKHQSHFQRRNETCVPCNHTVLLKVDPNVGKADHGGFED